MIKLVSDTIDKEDIKKLVAWLSGDEVPRLTKGELTRKFEQQWSEQLGRSYSVFVNSGSSAILLTLYSLLEGGYLKNKKVVAPGLSWATDVSSIFQIGLDPILCDCNMEDLSVDLAALEEIFKRENPSAFILVSVLGLVPDMKKIQKLCYDYQVILIEDVAESMGSQYQGKSLGTFGEASIFSLYYGHHLSTMEGGLISTDDPKLYDLLLAMRSHGWDRDLPKESQDRLRLEWKVGDFDALYTFYYPGFNLRPTDLQAFLGLNQLSKLKEFSEARRNNFILYHSLVKENQIKIGERLGDYVSSFAYPVVSKKREQIVKNLITAEVEVRPLIAGSIARSPFWIKKKGVLNLKNCDVINDFGFYIPNHQDLKEEQIQFICEIINEA